MSRRLFLATRRGRAPRFPRVGGRRGGQRSKTTARWGEPHRRPLPIRVALLICALAAYVGSAAFVIGADLWDPLADWGWWVVLASSLAIGLAVGRWPVLLAPLALIPLASLNRMSEPELFTSDGVYPLAIFFAVLVAAGIGVRALARRRGARADRGAARVGIGLICLALAFTAWGVYLDHRVVDRSPSKPLLLDERSGTFRVIAPGVPAEYVRSLFGRPVLGEENRVPTPLGEDFKDVRGPSSMVRSQAWRYRKLVVFVVGARVHGYLTTDPSAQTAAGVGVRDSLAIAERAYRNLNCFGVTAGSDAVNPSYPSCEGQLKNGNVIQFGGDPIASITVQERDPYIPARRPPIARRPGHDPG